jgi:hypothetical protein
MDSIMDRGRFSGTNNSTQPDMSGQQHLVQNDMLIPSKQRALLAGRPCGAALPLHADLLECCRVATATAADATANGAGVMILKDVLRDMLHNYQQLVLAATNTPSSNLLLRTPSLSWLGRRPTILPLRMGHWSSSDRSPWAVVSSKFRLTFKILSAVMTEVINL